MYFKSENVKVFPSAFRGKNDSDLWFDPEALMQTEHNIVNSGRGFKDSYIIEYGEILKCIIHGYYFEIYNEADLDTLNAIGDNVYLNIKLKETPLIENGGTVYKDTYKLDSFEDNIVILDTKIDGEYKFTGLTVSNELDENATAHLQIIKDGQINSSAFLPQIETGSSANGKAIQLGTNTEANGDSSLALGAYTYAVGENSVAEGNYTVAYGENSHASGEGEQFSDTTSNALTIASGGVDQPNSKITVLSAAEIKAGHIITDKTDYVKVTDVNANTITLSSIPAKVLAGATNTVWHIQNIAYDEAALTNGINNTASGKASHAEGYQTIASGNYSNATGQATTASGNCSRADGYNTKASGTKAHAEGTNTIASGQSAHAEGVLSEAQGDASHAEGQHAIAAAPNAHSEGRGTIAGYVVNGTVVSGNDSHAEGVFSQAFGNGAHAEGNMTTANGNYSHAEGEDTTASGQGAHTEGNNTIASGRNAHAEGDNTKANAEGSHTEGQNTEADGIYSHAEGDNTQIRQADYAHAEGTYTLVDDGSTAGHAEGKYTVVSNAYAHAEGIGNFEGELDVTNTKGQASGYGAHSEGELTVASGRAAHSEGYETSAANNYAHTEGKYTKANGIASHAEGGNPEPDDGDDPVYNIAQGDFSHVEGQRTKALGTASHAEGVGTLANGFGAHAEGNATQAGTQNTPANSAHAEGESTKAENTASHAEGYKTRATGKYAHAEGESDGNLKNAEGQSSHSEGYYTKALGKYSHAEGNNTRAYGEGAHAEGLGTVAQNDYELVVGKYNKYAIDSDEEPVADTRLFVVGAGTKTGNNDPVRKNAFEVVEDTTKTSQGGFDVKVGEHSLQDIIKSYLLDYVYPIGALYVSEYQNDGELGPDNKRRPNTLNDTDKNGCPIAELGGKWERVQGEVIYAAEYDKGTLDAGEPDSNFGLKDINGRKQLATGGRKDWELLKHAHSVTFSNSTPSVNSTTLTSTVLVPGFLNNSNKWKHEIFRELSGNILSAASDGDKKYDAIDDVIASGNHQVAQKLTINATHAHTFNPADMGLSINENGTEVNDEGHTKYANMPPYRCMFMWKRIK